jgi:hypothetical protein
MFCLKSLKHRGLASLVAAALLGPACGGDKGDESANEAPIAEAGSNQLLSTNAAVLLNATGSFDPDGDPISFHWAFDAVPTDSVLMDSEDAFLANDTNDPETSFSPDAEGSYVVSLIVTDGQGTSSVPDRLTVTINSGEAPTAEAGTDQTGSVGISLTLDGSASTDKRDRELSYAWSFAQVPPHSSLSTLSDASTVTPSFTPDASGLYLIALVVNNGLDDSSPDTTVIRVTASASDTPIANAGADIAGEDCTDIVLDGTESTDPNGEPLTYLWDLESRPAESGATVDTFADPEQSETTFYPDVEGEYIVSLSVHDGSSWSIPDEVTITADERSYNTPPALNPGLGQVYAGGEAICEEAAYSSYVCAYCEAQTITIGSDALINDPDNDTVTYTWTAETAGAAIHSPNNLETAVVLSGAQPTAPDECEPNTYRFRLTAVDCTGAESSQTVTHTVNCCGYTLGDEPL